MSLFADALEEAGGVEAPRPHGARLRGLLLEELGRGAGELSARRSGYEHPVVVAVSGADRRLRAAVPVPATLRVDPTSVVDRGWLLVAATIAALLAVGDGRGRTTALAAADLGGWLVLVVDTGAEPAADLAEYVPIDLDERVRGIDRLRARGLALPDHVLDAAGDATPPIGARHPLVIAEQVALAGGDPADQASVAEHEDAVLAQLDDGSEASRPHDDPDPRRRMARRVLQRLDGMGKWGGYHTEISHLPRGFATHERGLVLEIARALIDADLLVEKQSVGQRHVYLNSRRAREIRDVIDQGELPPRLVLP